MPTNPAPRKRNDRHIADQGVTLPTKTSTPVCTFDDVFNRRFNDGQHPLDKYRSLWTLSFMDLDDRTRAAKEAGYVLLSEDDGQEIYGRDDLPSTVEFDGIEWTLHLRDFNLDPVGHQHLGDARLHPAVAFEALMELDPAQLKDWML